MKSFRQIILATILLIAGVSVAAFSQVSKTKDLKKVSGEKVQSKKEKQDPASAGLKKLSLRSEDARDWEDWQDVDFDFDFDFEEIGTMVSESIEASLKSIDIRFEPMAIPIESIHIDMDPIEPIDIDIEPIDINIDMDTDIDVDIDTDEDMDIDMDISPGHGKHKDKHKEDKDKVKNKDKGEDKKQDKEKEKDKEDKSKGLKKIKGS